MHLRIAALMFALSASSGAAAQELDRIEQRLDALEAENATLEERLAELEANRGAMVASGSGARVSYGSPVRIGRGESVEQVTAYGEDVIVEGSVLGDATSFGGDVLVRDGAEIGGDAVSFGGEVVVEDGADVDGDRVAYAGDAWSDESDDGVLGWLYRRLIFLLSIAGAGILVVGLVPHRIGRVADVIATRPVRSAVVGTLTTGFLGVASLLFVLTILGLPIAFLLVAMLGLAWLLGFVGLCQAVGDKLPFREKHHGRWLAFLVGSLLLTFLGALPFIGWVVAVTASIVGIGAAVSSRLGGR